MKTIKKIVLKILSLFNLELKKIETTYNLIELSDSDKEIVHYVQKNELSMASPQRLTATLMAVKYVCNSKIEGDFVECGVWRGGNSIIALKIIGILNASKNVWMYDTFEGMTEPTQYDYENDSGINAIDEYKLNERDNHSEWCYASIEDVQENIKEFSEVSKINLIKGDIVNTLNIQSNLPKKISVLRLDTDWFESTKKELEVLYPLLSIGGVLIIDDYGHWGGCKKAVDEYFEKIGKKPLLIPSDYTGRICIKS